MSMYEALGGDALVREMVEIFYAKLQADPVTTGFFEGNDLAGLKSHQQMFLTAAFGGPDAYGGRDMRAAHAHLAITDTDFDRFLHHLGAALTAVGTSPEHVAEVLEKLDPLRQEIVHAPAAGGDTWGSQDAAGGSG